jgi:hypothetical protein
MRMRRTVVAAIAVLLFPAIANAERLNDAEIKRQMIEQSIASYSGNCPCPYNRARDGSRCGRRSAYNRPGGAEPLCYPQDVTQGMVQRYRQQHGLR